MQQVDISIIIPIYNEANNVLPLSQEIHAAMESTLWEWECIWVNDGSIDETPSILEKIARHYQRHKYLNLERNAGQSAALLAGFSHAQGDYVTTLDGDGQNDPKDIPRLLQVLVEKNVDMVNGYRQNRHDNIIRKMSSRIANFVRNVVTGKTVRDVGCSTRIMRRECTPFLPHFAGMHRFLPTLVSIYGFTLTEMPVNHRQRLSGQTKYGIANRLWVGIFDLVGVLWLRQRKCQYKIKM